MGGEGLRKSSAVFKPIQGRLFGLGAATLKPMSKTISKIWTFASDSNRDKEYETLEFIDGSTSCNCMGWTRRTAADGSRSCKHTRLVDMGRADVHCKASHNYQQKENHAKQNTANIVKIPQLGRRKFAV